MQPVGSLFSAGYWNKEIREVHPPRAVAWKERISRLLTVWELHVREAGALKPSLPSNSQQTGGIKGPQRGQMCVSVQFQRRFGGVR